MKKRGGRRTGDERRQDALRRMSGGRSTRLWSTLCLCAMFPSTLLARGGPEALAETTAGDLITRARTTLSIVQRLVYTVPGAEAARVLSYRYGSHEDDILDLYLPPSPPFNASLPVFISVNGNTTEMMKAAVGTGPRGFPVNIGWAAGMAANGIAAVLYDTNTPQKGFTDVFAFLERNARALGLDLDRLAIYANSGNGTLGSRLLGHPDYHRRIRVAVFYHGTLRTVGFLSADIACLVVSSPEQPAFHNAAEVFVRRATVHGLDVTWIDDAPYKNFEAMEDTPEARDIIRQTFEFVLTHIGKTEETK